MTLMEAVSDRLKRLKKEKKFTSYKIQKEGGVPRSTVGKLVSMKFNTVQLDTIYQIACTDWENDRHRDMFVVYKTPQIAEEGDIWQNHYTVLGVGLYGRRPVVSEEQFHEADLALCPLKDLEREPYCEQLAALQNVITGKVVLPEDIWNKILHGRIIFNTCPSWRDIPELFDKSAAGKS